ncbi:outer membrane beta-barrel protein [Chryseobacterium sp. DT-3]|uniref:outer membrane beta-barrel protein n=1 Tax=Chryseobacterium sp. DT-3 TaxID=3396164 RepID=UPI003F1C3F01
MKKISLLTGLLLSGIYYTQIKFEKGYLIDNQGKRTEVLIKNLDWKNNPVEFEYKLEEKQEIKKENIKNIQEFGIDGNSRYIRKTVMIDQSSTALKEMSDDKAPEFKEETIFLNYIVDGKAGLLYYCNEYKKRIFYTLNGSEPRQLIYKPYYITENNIAYNEDYKKQIAENLNCGINSKLLERAEYTEKSLTDIFVLYNECSGGEIVKYEQEKKKKDVFNLNIRPGINFTSFSTSYLDTFDTDETNFENKISFRIGLEAEFILPFNKNKWALFVEPTYQSYKSEAETIVDPGNHKTKSTIDYKSIEIPFGIRHYFFLNNDSKIFINLGYVVDIKMSSSFIQYQRAFDIKSGNNFVFGAGFKYNNKFSAEFRIGTSRNLFKSYRYLSSNYNTTSIILGYTLF